MTILELSILNSDNSEMKFNHLAYFSYVNVCCSEKFGIIDFSVSEFRKF